MHLIDKNIFLFQISFVCLKRLKIELAHYKIILIEVLYRFRGFEK
jgi:hypothetical protein